MTAAGAASRVSIQGTVAGPADEFVATAAVAEDVVVNPTITHGVVGDLPVLTCDLSMVFTGALVFGVGLRDEDPRTAGIAHLTEHLVMSRIGRLAVRHNAATADDSIRFYAQGAPEQVADFLNRVAQSVSSLSEITDDDVAAQRRIIAAELGDGDEMTGQGALLDRFGATDLGLLDFGSPAHRSHTRADVLAFAHRWLHAANAMLTFTGAVPATLNVELPSPRALLRKPRVEVADVAAVHGWVAGGPGPLALSVVLAGGTRACRLLATEVLLEALLHELRTQENLIYSAQSYVATIGPDARLAAAVLDPTDADLLPAAAAAVAVLRRLAHEGPSEELLEFVLLDWENAMAHPETHEEALQDFAAGILRGMADADDLDTGDLRQVAHDDVQAMLASAYETLLLSVDDLGETDGPDEMTRRLGLPMRPGPTSFFAELAARSGLRAFSAFLRDGVQLFSPKMFRGLGGHQLILDEERLTHIVPGLGFLEVRYDDVVLAGISEQSGAWDLTTSSGDGLVVLPDDWRGGAKVVAHLERLIPQQVRHPTEQRSAEPGKTDYAAATHHRAASTSAQN